MDITISVVEDNAELRESLVRFLSGSPGFRLVSAYPDAEQALAQLPKEKPAVVLMDINLPRMNGIECVRRLKEQMPQVLVVMLTVYEDSQQIFQALAAGACGYLVKRVQPDELLQALHEVHRGGSPMSSHIARKVVLSFQENSQKPQRETDCLSPREQEVLDHLARGLSYKQIADQLGLSIDSVRTYIRRIYEKLHVRSRTEAVVKYLQK
jgi:DNA-binding NarL/FixJ family response regulator